MEGGFQHSAREGQCSKCRLARPLRLPSDKKFVDRYIAKMTLGAESNVVVAWLQLQGYYRARTAKGPPS